MSTTIDQATYEQIVESLGRNQGDFRRDEALCQIAEDNLCPISSDRDRESCITAVETDTHGQLKKVVAHRIHWCKECRTTNRHLKKWEKTGGKRVGVTKCMECGFKSGW